MSVGSHEAESFDHLAEQYDFEASLNQRFEVFLENLPTGRRAALDVGCGSGILALELSNHFERVVAFDISEPMLAIAKRERPAPNVDYHWASAEEFASAERFDLIVSNNTFHHVSDVPATLDRLRALLAPGGRLVIVDVIRRHLLVPQHHLVFLGGAFLQLPGDVLRHGPRVASRLLRFRASRPWRDHLATDRYLTRPQFREVYLGALPGARLLEGDVAAVIWDAHEEHD